jgi:hypothetical protein
MVVRLIAGGQVKAPVWIPVKEAPPDQLSGRVKGSDQDFGRNLTRLCNIQLSPEISIIWSLPETPRYIIPKNGVDNYVTSGYTLLPFALPLFHSSRLLVVVL